MTYAAGSSRNIQRLFAFLKPPLRRFISHIFYISPFVITKTGNTTSKMTFKTFGISALVIGTTFTNAMTYKFEKTFKNERAFNDDRSKSSVVAFGLLDDGYIESFDVKTSSDVTFDMMKAEELGKLKHVPEFQDFLEKKGLNRRRSVHIEEGNEKLKALEVEETEETQDTESTCFKSPGFGLYGIMVHNDDNIEYPLTVSGTIHIRHVHGELSPAMWKGYTYYHYALMLIAAMIFSWAFLMFRYAKSLVMHHRAIAFVLGIVALETLLKYFYLMYTNQNGMDTLSITADHIVAQVQVLRQTAVRLFLILISLGWGVTLSTSQITMGMKQQLMQFGLLYYWVSGFAAYITRRIIHNQGDGTSDLHVAALTMIGLYMLEAKVYMVVTSNLERILVDLKQQGQYEKFEHYRKFTKGLLVNIAFAFIHINLELMVRNHMNEYFDWMVLVRECFWHLLFLKIIISVMILWRPTKESKTFAFMEQLPMSDPDAPMGFGELDIPDLEDGVEELGMNLDLDVENMDVDKVIDYHEDPEIADTQEMDISVDLEDSMDMDLELEYDLYDMQGMH